MAYRWPKLECEWGEKMNKRGLTLIEIILALAILGILAASFLPVLTAVFKNVFQAKDITKGVYLTQQQLELAMEVARNEDTSPEDLSIEIFGKNVVGHDLQLNVVDEKGGEYGQVNVFVPKYKVEYNVPKVKRVDLSAYSGEAYISNPSRIYPFDSSVKLVGSHVMESEEDFLMNIYRWYMSPVTTERPSNYQDWIIVKEWNEARAELSYGNSNDWLRCQKQKTIDDLFSIKLHKQW